MLENQRPLCLRDFRIHAVDDLTGMAQTFMASKVSIDFTEIVSGSNHEVCHSLDLFFSLQPLRIRSNTHVIYESLPSKVAD